ncbi:hypothetical protein FOA52_000149 [Chlamydomonas sp. UWO 241]|nr:hypothetical protein FOA52_000149 [Chlamydomonas sp. UWO 241]
MAPVTSTALDFTIEAALARPTGWSLQRLAAFRDIVRHTALPSDEVPVMFPIAESFRLFMQAMALPQFPLSVLGSVLARNRTEVYRAMRLDEKLMFKCTVGPTLRVTAKGDTEVDLIGTAWSSDSRELVWRSTVTVIVLGRNRVKGRTATGGDGAAVASDAVAEVQMDAYSLGPGVGRHYGWISSDLNPIHVHWTTSQLLGFKRPIAHALFLVGRLEASLRNAGVKPAYPCLLQTEFKRPTLLPAKLAVVWQVPPGIDPGYRAAKEGLDFRLMTTDSPPKEVIVGRLVQGAASGMGGARHVSLGLLAGVVLLLILAVCRKRSAQEPRWAVYIDGGSSGSRVHVFQYGTPTRPHTYASVTLPEASTAVEPGLSAFAHAPHGAGDSLRPLLEFAYLVVPAGAWHATPVRLLATAGLRLVDEPARSHTLDSCRAVLDSSSFAFRHDWATVISGDMEGLFAWVGANYANGALQAASVPAGSGSRKERAGGGGDGGDGGGGGYTGVMELGGASFQVTFMPDTAPSQQAPLMELPVQLPGVHSRLYTHSFLGLGLDSAMAAASAALLQSGERSDPCLPVGFTASDGRQGNASFDACLKMALSVLQVSGCTDAVRAADAARQWHTTTATVATSTTHDAQAREEEQLPGETAARRGSALPTHDGSPDGQAIDAPVQLAGVEGDDMRKRKLQQQQEQQQEQQEQPHTGDRHEQRCSMGGVAVPLLSGSFLAVENLAWTASVLGLSSTASLQELSDAGRAYCATHWSSLQAQFSGHTQERFLTRYCFGAAYTFALLRVGLGIGLHERRLVFTNTLPSK